jgi:DNA polymerase-1
MIDIKKIVRPEQYGCSLHINDYCPDINFNDPVVIDVETDEKDHFVGLALCQSDKYVYYYSYWCAQLKGILNQSSFIMHGGNFDYVMLQKWGIPLTEDRYKWDTKILVYSVDSTLKKYGLKPLSKKLLDMEWPSYKEMVGKGENKVTLDKQDTERVSNYCSMDALATYKLYKWSKNRIRPKSLEWYESTEFPLYRTFAKIPKVYFDVPRLKELDTMYKQKSAELGSKIISFFDKSGFAYPNKEKFLNSPKQIIEAFNFINYPIKSSGAKVLEKINCEPAKLFTEYRSHRKAWGTYTEPFLEVSTLPEIEAGLRQSTDTGRLSSRLHCVPRRKPHLKPLREAFSSPPGTQLLCLDYSQIETRFLAHFSQDPVLLDIFTTGKNIHRTLADSLNVSYDVAKTCVHGMTYGATAYSIKNATGKRIEECEEILSNFWNELKVAKRWIDKEKKLCYINKGIETIGGRFREFKDLYLLRCPHSFTYRCDTCKLRRHVENQMISTKVQGSAADLIKIAMVDCFKNGYPYCLQVHDELHFQIAGEEVEREVARTNIKHYMDHALQLSVPIIAEGNYGRNWAECK